MALALRETSVSSGEQDLVCAVRQGDERAFEQLFSRYRRRITGYVYALVGDYGRAEDITQEVFISALRRLRETHQPIAFKPWIYEIARNACIDEFRRSRRATVVPLDDEQAQHEIHGTGRIDSSPEAHWELGRQLRNLFGAFSGLSENHHQILVLRELEGLSYAEIAERMGISRPVVESTLFRARRRLTQEYADLDSGRRCEDVRATVDGCDVRALARLGVRERRRIVSHLDHCDDCLRYARMAGVDSAALQAPARRVAALIPFGWLPAALRQIRAAVSSRHGGAAMAARTAQRASTIADGAGPAFAIGRAIAAAAALFVVGTGLPGAGAARRPTTTVPQVRPARATQPVAAPATRHPHVTRARAAAVHGRPTTARTPYRHRVAPREPAHGVLPAHRSPSRATPASSSTGAGTHSPPSGLTPPSVRLPGPVSVPPTPGLPSPSTVVGQVANQVGNVLAPASQVVSQAGSVVNRATQKTVGAAISQTAATAGAVTTTLGNLLPPPGG